LRSVLQVLFSPQYWRKDVDALFASPDVPSKFAPHVEACDVGCIWFLQNNEHDIVQRVFMKAADGREILRQSFAVPGFERSCQILDGFFSEFCNLLGIHLVPPRRFFCLPSVAAQSAAKKNKRPSWKSQGD
jgi:hypothetical protein